MKMQIRLMLTVLLFSGAAAAKDLLPYKFHSNHGEVTSQSSDALVFIDNSGMYLVPDKAGQHQTLMVYRAEELNSVPYLEVRYRGTAGHFQVEIQREGQWQPLATLRAKNNQWVRKKFELGDNVTAFASKKRNVLIRVTATDKAETLEIDFFGITADEEQKNLKKVAAHW